MPRQELKSQNGQALCVESYADEYSAPCCMITEAGLQAIRDGSLLPDAVSEFAQDIFATASEGMEPEPCYVVHFEGRWPELYSEEALQESLESYVSGMM